MAVERPIMAPARRLAVIVQRTFRSRAKRTGARYSPPPTPLTPATTPIGIAAIPAATSLRETPRAGGSATLQSSRALAALNRGSPDNAEEKEDAAGIEGSTRGTAV